MSDPTEAPTPETVDVNGHLIPVDEAEMFFDGETGEPITDEQWDVQKARIAQFDDDPDAVTWIELVDEEGAPE